MTDKLTDKEIIKECPFEEQMDCYKEQIKEYFSRYKNESGCEDCIEVCLIRAGYRTVLKAEEEINRLQARVKKCEKVEHYADKTIATLQAENERLIVECGNQSTLWSKHFEGIFETAKETIKAEAYKEFAENVKKQAFDGVNCVIHEDVVFVSDIDNLLKEMVGEDNESKN